MVMEIDGFNVLFINGMLNGYGMEVECMFFLGDVLDVCFKFYEIMMEVWYMVYKLVVFGVVMVDVD